MTTVRYTVEAQQDLQAIFQYLDEKNPQAARTVISRIQNSAMNLEMWPELAPSANEYGGRKLPVPGLPYVIGYAYEEDTDRVEIIGIFHTAQEVERKRQDATP
jgi:toxin ParE1/3/4